MDTLFLSQTMLFQEIPPEDIPNLLHCLQVSVKHYDKGAFIFHTGDRIRTLGLVLSGRVQIESHDPWGNRSVLDSVSPGMVFAETYASIPEEPLMVDVCACEPSGILFLSVNRLLEPCSRACSFHSKMIRNLLSISARKNLNLSRRIFHTASKSIRGRVLSYLSFQAAREGSTAFTIPFNRQQLADYLGVERSALSKELGRMQKEGLIETKKNFFRLLQ